MRKHPLLALFTTTLTLTTTGAAGHAFASSAGPSPRHASGATATDGPSRTTAPIHAIEDAAVVVGPGARTAARALRGAGHRRPGPGATALLLVRDFVRSDVSAAEPLALDLVLGSPTGRTLAARSARLQPSPVVRELVAATLHRATRVVQVPHAGGPWLALRMCESGGNYAADTGNGYYGAYQFSPSTWWWMGYSGMPDNAPPAVQDQAAERLMQRVGWSAWPVCSVTLGLR